MASEQKFGNFIGKTWAQVLLALLVGSYLAYKAPDEGLWKLVNHLGIGLVEAALVTMLLHVRELTEFFENFAAKVLTKDEYMMRLRRPALEEIRSKAARTIMDSYVDNAGYDKDHLYNWVDSILYKMLPGIEIPSGLYREDYRETIVLEFLPLGDALNELNLVLDNFASEDLSAILLKITSTCEYKVVSPSTRKEGFSKYEVKYSGIAADMPVFPVEHRVSLHVGHAYQDSKPVSVIFESEEMGGISYRIEPQSFPFTDGACQVWMQSVEYLPPTRQPYVLNQMNMPTKNVDVTLFQYGSGPRLVFDGDVIAIGAKGPAERQRGRIRLDYKGWLFESHGYFIWWWEL